MAVVFKSYPALTEDIRKKIGYSPSGYEFRFTLDDAIIPLESVQMNESSGSMDVRILKLDDKLGRWTPAECSLIIEGKCAFQTPTFLFGKNGIACHDAVLGIAVEWSSRDSSRRGIVPVGEISASSSPRLVRQKLEFPAGIFRGEVRLNTVLYLKKAGKPADGENHLANRPGMILGVLDQTRLIMDGNGSVFPVVMIEKNNDQLWWVECNWADALSDPFTEDNFCLFINRKNTLFEKLDDGKGGIRPDSLLFEIVCQTIHILISRVMNNPGDAEKIRNGSKDIMPSSVAAVVYYLINTFEWKVNTDEPEFLSHQIHSSLSGKMGDLL